MAHVSVFAAEPVRGTQLPLPATMADALKEVQPGEELMCAFRRTADGEATLLDRSVDPKQVDARHGAQLVVKSGDSEPHAEQTCQARDIADLKRAVAELSQRVQVLEKPQLTLLAAQVLQCSTKPACDKLGHECKPSCVFARRAEMGSDSLNAAAQACGVPNVQDFATMCDRILSRRNNIAHPQPFSAIEAQLKDACWTLDTDPSFARQIKDEAKIIRAAASSKDWWA